jgi:hypothetical protein
VNACAGWHLCTVRTERRDLLLPSSSSRHESTYGGLREREWMGSECESGDKSPHSKEARVGRAARLKLPDLKLPSHAGEALQFPRAVADAFWPHTHSIQQRQIQISNRSLVLVGDMLARPEAAAAVAS